MADFAKLILAAETGDLKRAQAELDKVAKSADRAEQGVKKSSKGMADGFARAQQAASSFGLAMSAAITAPLLALGASSIRYAADLTEVQGKFNVVFGSLAESTSQWAGQTSDAMNRSRTDFMAYASGFQDLLVPMGFTREKAAELSKQFVELGVDVASFNNASDPEAINALRSAIVGSSEPMLRFGVDTRAARVEQELLAMGINKSYQEATEQEKVIARLNIALSMSADAIGDAERTAGSLTNQMKGMNADLKTVGETIGLILVPYAQEAVTALRGLTDWFTNLSPATQEIIVRLGAVAAAIGPLLLGVSGLMMVAKPLVAVLGAGGVSGALGALGTAATGPIGLTIIALTALGLAFFKVRDMANEYGEAVRIAADKSASAEVKLLGLQKSLLAMQGSGLDVGKNLAIVNQRLAELEVQSLATARGIKLNGAEVSTVAAMYLKAQSQIGGTTKTLEEFIGGMKEATVATGGYVATAEELEAAKKRGEALDKQAAELRRELMSDLDIMAEKVGIYTTLLGTKRIKQDEFNEAVKRLTFEQWEKSLLDSSKALREADALSLQLGGTIDGMSEKSFDELAVSVRGLVGEIERQFGSLGNASAAVLAEIGALFDMLRERHLKEFNKFIKDEILPSMEEWGKATGPLADEALANFALIDEALEGLFTKLPELANFTAVQAAFNSLSTQGTAELVALSANAEKVFRTIKDSGIANATQLMEAEKAMLEARKAVALAVGVDLTREEQKRLDALLAMYGSHTDEMSQFAIQAARNIQTAFADFLFNPFEGGLKKLFSNFSATLRRMAAEMAASKLGDALFGKDGKGGGILSGLGSKLGGVLSGLGSKLGGMLGGVGKSIGGALSSVLGAASSFIPVIGPLIGAAVGAFLPKIGSALFGGKFKTTDAGLQLGLGSAGVTGSSFEEQHRKGGLFRGSKDRTLITALDATTAQGFQDAYDSIIDSAQVVFAGIGADIDRSVLESVRVAGLKISAEGKSEAEIQALIDQWFESLNAAVVGAAAESAGALSLLALARDGETASQAIMRLGSQIQGVNDVLAVMGTTLLSVSVDGAAFADNMVLLAGGVDALASGVGEFVEHFHSEERKFERLQGDLTAAFAALGLEIPATRDAVAALVDGLDLTTEAGQRAFVAITGASTSLKSFFSSLETQAAAAAEAAAASARAAEEARAAEAAAAAQRIQESRTGTDAALGALRESIGARKAALQRERDEAAKAVQETAAVSQQVNQSALSAAQAALSALTPELQAISSATSSLRSSIAGGEARARAEALATVRRALETGNLAGAGEAAGIAARVESGSFSTAADFRREQARTLALLGQLELEGEKQVDQAEAAVRAIQAQTSVVERAASVASVQASSQFDDEMAALDKQLAEAEEQVNLLRGIETGVLSMAEALASFRSAIEVERGLESGRQPTLPQHRGQEREATTRMENTLRSIEEYSRTTARTNTRLLGIDDRRRREEVLAAEVV